MAAGPLQHPGPFNIVFLIEPGLQFDQDSDLLVVLRGPGQRRDDGRIAADPVQGLLDGQDIGIFRRLPDKIHHRAESLEGMEHKDIPFPDPVKDIAAGRQFRHFLGSGVTVLPQFFKALDAIDLHQESQINGAVNGIDLVLVHSQLLLQEVQQALIGALLDLQTDSLSPLPLAQLFLDLLEQVFCFFLIHGQIRVAHDAVGIAGQHVVIEEKLIHIGTDDLLQQDDPDTLFLFAGQADQTRQDAGHLDGGEFPCRFLCLIRFPGLLGPAQDTGAGLILSGQDGAQVQALIADQRKRPGIVDGHRGQDRKDLRIEIIIDIDLFLSRQILT